jgi:hypothetical protein
MKILIVLLIATEKAAAHIFHDEDTMIATPAAQPIEAQQKATPADALLEIRPTRFGKGVFARRGFTAGSRILQFRGRVYTRAEYLSKMNPVKCHYMQIGENAFLGPTTTPDNFVNHCCEPNAGLKVENGKAWLVAIQSIQPGEEITFDYSTSMAEDHWEMDCACGVASCRSRIRDFKHLAPSLQQKYIELGIVPDFVIRSAGRENPYDLFHALSRQEAKSGRKRRGSSAKTLSRTSTELDPSSMNHGSHLEDIHVRANLGSSMNHGSHLEDIHVRANLGSSMNHASPAY